ncbi:hypothetical protein KUCAC02_006503, partial [Chaenocephalus aceratus]
HVRRGDNDKSNCPPPAAVLHRLNDKISNNGDKVWERQRRASYTARVKEESRLCKVVSREGDNWSTFRSEEHERRKDGERLWVERVERV